MESKKFATMNLKSGLEWMRCDRNEMNQADEEGTKRKDELAEMDEGQKRRDKYVQNELNCFTRQEEGTRTKNYYIRF